MILPGLYCVSQGQFPHLKGPYLGQSSPGLKPVIFAPGIVSTEKNELNSVFTPDGKEFYFSSFDPGRGYTIMVMKESAGGWTSPRTASFSGRYSEVDMFITHDGKYFFFTSGRKGNHDIYWVDAAVIRRCKPQKK
jgi:Tol biopolymer transport system component